MQSGVTRKCWAFFVLGFGLMVILLYVFVNEVKKYKSSSLITHKIDDYEFNLTTQMTPTGSLMNLTLDSDNF